MPPISASRVSGSNRVGILELPSLVSAVSTSATLGVRSQAGESAHVRSVYAEHWAGKIGVVPPEWAFAPWHTSEDPVFDEGSTPALRTRALVRAPLAFKRRNIFTHSVDLPLALRAGRPTKSAGEKRRANAERQRRFRANRRAELATLRKQVRKRAR